MIIHNYYYIIHLGQEGLKMDQDKETKIRAWIKHGIDSGRAIVSPAGFHKVAPKSTFQQRLDSCNTIQELEGFANRRKYSPSLPRWTENERAAIIHKKTEMQNVKRKRK
tara:strand:+ start:102 stop:428 length:327 start_codon:yes stop_codon:yes gene_type:complete